MLTTSVILFLWSCSYQIEEGEWLPGGDTTNTFLLGSNAFIMPAENMLVEHEPSFYTGNSFFNQAWVETPASTENRDGLGPLFNARSCAACHFKDGRGAPPEEDESFLGLLLRISLPGETEHGAPVSSSLYGNQIQPFAVLDVPAEATPVVTYKEIYGEYGDGESYSLLTPTYQLTNAQYGEPDSALMISPRVAPSVIGMGLLEAIPPERLNDLADPDDLDGDGISGKVNLVWDETNGVFTIGRFGWKAEQPSVEQQVASAFLGDIGITNPIFTENNCAPAQQECLEEPVGGDPEIRQELFDKVILYTALLAVPVRRNWEEPTVRRGKKLFTEIGCISCHVSSHTTGIHPQWPEVSEQLIWPYTDLLLHDMGEGLADNRPVFEANGSEWRTPPLWSIGLVESVNNHTRFLHDGRARNLAEAILWHGGEAEAAKESFRLLEAEDRQAILLFLESL